MHSTIYLVNLDLFNSSTRSIASSFSSPHCLRRLYLLAQGVPPPAPLRLRTAILFLPFLMSTSVDARRRPSLWSYISFTSSPRRRSVSLPTRNSHDPFEKEDRHRGNGWAKAPTGTVENIKDAWMTQSQRSRYLKTGGIIGFLLLLIFWFSSRDSAGVRELVTGV